MDELPLIVSGLDHFFGEGEARKQALFSIDLRVARGSLTVLMGPSGSGKTTLLTLMGCLRDVQSGSVRLLGTELNGTGEATQLALRRRLGFIFQAHNLHDSLTARQNVLTGLQVHGRGDPSVQANAVEIILRLTVKVAGDFVASFGSIATFDIFASVRNREDVQKGLQPSRGFHQSLLLKTGFIEKSHFSHTVEMTSSKEDLPCTFATLILLR